MQGSNYEIPSLNINFGKNIPAKGSLIHVPAYVIILNCFKNNFSGRIIFENKQRIKHVYFDQGNILNLHSNLQDDSFKNIILKKQLLDQEKVKKVAIKLDEIEAFRKENILEHHEQAKYLLNLDDEQVKAIERHVCLEKLLDLLGWFQGEYLIQSNYTHQVPKIQFGVYLEVLYKNLQNFFLHALPLFEQNYQSPKIEKSKFKNKQAIINTSVSNVLSSLSYYNATGWLTLQKDDFTKKIQFLKGNIKSIQSNKMLESLKTTLFRWNFLPEEKSNFLTNYTDNDLEKLLLDDKSLTQDQMAQAKKILKFEQYLQVFHWKLGYFEFTGNLTDNDTQPLPADLMVPGTLINEQSNNQDILKIIHTLEQDTVFIVFKENISVFKSFISQTGYKAIESSFLDNEEFTIAQEPLDSNQSKTIHYMLWEKLSYYTALPDRVVSILHKDMDLNFLKNMRQELQELSIENLGFFTLN